MWEFYLYKISMGDGSADNFDINGRRRKQPSFSFILRYHTEFIATFILNFSYTVAWSTQHRL
jgi:hypothetical protein